MTALLRDTPSIVALETAQIVEFILLEKGFTILFQQLAMYLDLTSVEK